MRSQTFETPQTEVDPVLDRLVVRLAYLRREQGIVDAQREHLQGEIDDTLDKMMKRLSVGYDDPTENNTTRDQPDDVPRPPAFVPGDRVEVTIRDQYRGRRGTIIEPHGKKAAYWWLRLDAKAQEREGPLIYKAPSSLKLLLPK